MTDELPRYIEVETSRLCNRRCGWCPNSTHDDRSVQELMPWPLLTRIIEELAEAGYRGWLALHNYNEPLANPRLEEELAYIREQLPGVRSSVFTNGDLLDRHRFERLRALGLAYLRVSVYPSAMTSPPIPRDGDVIERWLSRKNLADFAPWRSTELRQGPALVATVGSLRVEVIRPDVQKYNWRGGSVPILETPCRRFPCLMTRHSLSIDYGGRLKMCCNVLAEEPTHSAYIVGNVANLSLLTLWRSEPMQRWRDAHARADWSFSPVCQGCSHRLPPEQEAEFITDLGLGK
jgi:MoaA/NifB/PqqE/SkfB family radical SAM enzyme